MSDTPMTREPTWAVVEGDVCDRLRDLPAASVQCVVTSPPYWGLRDYGAECQIGLEPTPEAYVESMVEVFREVRRVLRDDGTVWLNLGDSYASAFACARRNIVGEGSPAGDVERPNRLVGGLKEKDLVGIPWRVAFALQADGWYLRSDIIWAKPNPMPESVTDRPTKSHEYVFLLSKSARYYFDADAVRSPFPEGTLARIAQGGLDEQQGGFKAEQYEANFPGKKMRDRRPADVLRAMRDKPEQGANIRTVWNIATEPFSGAHFATFPKKLVEPCVKAGTSERGCCCECGQPFVRMTDGATYYDGSKVGSDPQRKYGSREYGRGPKNNLGQRIAATTGWVPGCTHHESGIVPCTVLDPFCGSGTTGLVALRLGRSFVGIELNPTYAEMARDRIRNDAPLFNVEAEVVRD